VIGIRDNIRGGALTETTFLVLLALYRPNHGYGISQFVVHETAGRVKLGAGTLYGAMDNLSRKKWIAPLKDKGCARRKEYVITDLGKQMAANGWRLVKTSTLFYENQHV
jgi:DNA-binding PadR family transcriptional regulator